MRFIITTSMAGAHLPEGDTAPEPFEADQDEAIQALLDEAEYQLGDIYDDGSEAEIEDTVYLESLRGSEGREDLAMALGMYGCASIGLESLFNTYGGSVTLALVTE